MPRLTQRVYRNIYDAAQGWRNECLAGAVVGPLHPRSIWPKVVSNAELQRRADRLNALCGLAHPDNSLLTAVFSPAAAPPPGSSRMPPPDHYTAVIMTGTSYKPHSGLSTLANPDGLVQDLFSRRTAPRALETPHAYANVSLTAPSPTSTSTIGRYYMGLRPDTDTGHTHYNTAFNYFVCLILVCMFASCCWLGRV